MKLQSWAVLILGTAIGLLGCSQSQPAPNPATGVSHSAPPATMSETPAATPDVAASAGGMDSTSTMPTSRPTPAAGMPNPAPAASPVEISGDLQSRVRAALEKAKPVKAELERKNALKQIGLALHNFHDTFNHFPALDSMGEPTSKAGLSWRVYLLPYLEQAPLFNEFHQDEPWDSEHNKGLIARMPKIFGDDPEGKTRIQVFTGEGAPFQPGVGLGLRNIVDGTSNTIAVVEAGPDVADIWTKPTGLTFDAADPWKALGNVDDPFRVLMMDGRVLTLAKNIGALALLIQHADGNVLPDELDLFQQSAAKSAAASAEGPLPPLPPLAAPASAVDTRLIPADAVAVGIMQPRRFLEHALVQDALKRFGPKDRPPRELLQEMLPQDMTGGLREAFDIQLDAIEEVRFVVGKELLEFADQPRPGPPPAAAAVRTAVPLNIETIVASFARTSRELEERDQGGVMYLYDPQQENAVCFLSEHEILAGHEGVVKSMLAAGTADTPLTQSLTSMGNRLLLLAFASDEVGPKIAQQAQFLPPGSQVFMPYVTDLRGLSLAIDLDAAELLQLAVQFQKPAMASGLEGMLQGLLQSGRDQFEQMKPQLEQGDQAPLIPLATELVEGLKLGAEGDTVRFTVARPEHLSDLPAALEPAFSKAREASQRTQQMNQLKQVGLAMHNFQDVYRHFPALDGIGDPQAKTGLSWRVHLLPFLDQAALYDKFHRDEPWDSEHNKTLIAKMPAIFGENPDGKSRLHVLTGGGSPFVMGRGVGIRDITDGTSNTIMIVEAGEDTAEIWTKPSGLEFDPKNPLKCLGTLLGDGFHALLMDGSVRFISNNIDPQTFRKMVQHQDGEPLGF